MYEYHIIELRDEELNVKIIAVMTQLLQLRKESLTKDQAYRDCYASAAL